MKYYSHFEHNLLHFFVRALKFSDKDDHDFSGVVIGRFIVHEGNKIANGLQEGSKTFATMSSEEIIKNQWLVAAINKLTNK